MKIVEIKAAGVAWARREAESVADASDIETRWLSSPNDAYPLVEGDSDGEDRYDIAAAINDAAREEWATIVEEIEAAYDAAEAANETDES